jgi:hypothetical protein
MGGLLMSLQTTLARAALRDAEAARKRHRTVCGICTAAARARKWTHLCDTGFVAHDDVRLAKSELEQSKQTDAAPITGQGMLL